MRTASRRSSTAPFRLQRLEDRCVPAVISEVPLNTSLPAPQGIAAGPDGALWYGDPGANKIGRISTTGVVTVGRDCVSAGLGRGRPFSGS